MFLSICRKLTYIYIFFSHKRIIQNTGLSSSLATFAVVLGLFSSTCPAALWGQTPPSKGVYVYQDCRKKGGKQCIYYLRGEKHWKYAEIAHQYARTKIFTFFMKSMSGKGVYVGRVGDVVRNLYVKIERKEGDRFYE